MTSWMLADRDEWYTHQSTLSKRIGGYPATACACWCSQRNRVAYSVARRIDLFLLPIMIKRLFASRLVGNAAIYIVGNMLAKAASFFMIPVYTRFLSPDDFGITGLMAAFCGVLEMILGLGIYGGVARNYFDYRDSPKRVRAFLTTNFVFLSVGAGCAFLILQSFGEPFWVLISGSTIPFSPYVPLTLWAAYAAILSNVPLVMYQNEQRPVAFIVAQGGCLLLNVGWSILFVVSWRMGAEGQLLGRLVAGVASCAVLSFLFLRRYFSLDLRWEYLSVSLIYGLPLIPHMVSTWAMTYIDRVILEHFVPLAELGLYNLANQLSIVMSVLVMGVNAAWSPYYLDLMKRDPSPERQVEQVTSLYVGVVGAICVILVLFSPEVLVFLTPLEYHGAAKYIPLLMVSYLLTGYYYFASMPLFYYKKTLLLPLITVAAATSNVVLNLWWAPQWGGIGATWATVVAAAVMLGLSHISGRRFQRLQQPLWRYGLVTGLIIFAALVITYGPLNDVSLATFLGKLLVVGAFALVCFRWLVYPTVVSINRARESRSLRGTP